MNKKIYTLLLVVVILASVMTYAAKRPKDPQSVETTRISRQKWEHCAIHSIEGKEYDSFSSSYRSAVANIHYYIGTGLKEEIIEGKNRTEARAKAIAKLGEEGWEMVQQGEVMEYSEKQAPAIFFKRPKT